MFHPLNRSENTESIISIENQNTEIFIYIESKYCNKKE